MPHVVLDGFTVIFSQELKDNSFAATGLRSLVPNPTSLNSYAVLHVMQHPSRPGHHVLEPRDGAGVHGAHDGQPVQRVVHTPRNLGRADAGCRGHGPSSAEVAVLDRVQSGPSHSRTAQPRPMADDCELKGHANDDAVDSLRQLREAHVDVNACNVLYHWLPSDIVAKQVQDRG
ncbi:hypothetical protein DFH11DRAFT_1732441 [Phellopilus nigrolimitatus]|nr:hypothetical protein DFH11DRAFT_1732441 [Phellopilus nigrolimitatus]